MKQHPRRTPSWRPSQLEQAVVEGVKTTVVRLDTGEESSRITADFGR